MIAKPELGQSDAGSTVSTSISDAPSGSIIGNDLEMSASAARARSLVVAIVPELETYRWHDDYFDKKSDEHTIIAVFDHDPELLELSKKRLQDGLLKFCAPMSVVALILAALANWQSVPTIIAILSPFWIIMALCLYWSRGHTMEHTAVTTKGLITVDKLGNTYYFPFDDIVSIGPFHQIPHLHGSHVELKRVVSCYQVSSTTLKACCFVFRVNAHVIEHQTDREFFWRVVSAVQTLHDRGDLVDDEEKPTSMLSLYRNGDYT